jgi:putative ABC transport system permease protein
MAGGASAVVVSNRMAAELAAGPDVASVVDTTLTLQGQPWTIVGVLAPFPGERLFSAIVPFGASARATVAATPPRPHAILVKAPRIEDVVQVRHQIDAWADATNPGWRAHGDVVIATTGLDRLQQLNQGIRLFKMGAFTAISLVVGGIGIMNVLLASVMERTREIGVRKATGAKRRDIVAQFLAESVTISLAGALLGAVVGL